jgi:hypothetical protein
LPTRVQRPELVRNSPRPALRADVTSGPKPWARRRQVVYASVLLSAVVCKAAPSATLFDGTSLPAQQGWSVFSSGGGDSNSGPNPRVSFESRGVISGGLSVETAGTRIHRYSYQTHADELVATIRVKVLASSHNAFDSGFYFSLSDNGLLGDRANSIYISPEEIGFADGRGHRQPVDGANYHDYSMQFRAGTISVFVDQTLDDIRNGAAHPVLSRQVVPGDPGFTAGVVGFGDNSNDGQHSPAANSTYVVKFVEIENLSSAPANVADTGPRPDRATSILTVSDPAPIRLATPD